LVGPIERIERGARAGAWRTPEFTSAVVSLEQKLFVSIGAVAVDEMPQSPSNGRERGFLGPQQSPIDGSYAVCGDSY
jgi:hypothetical protein